MLSHTDQKAKPWGYFERTRCDLRVLFLIFLGFLFDFYRFIVQFQAGIGISLSAENRRRVFMLSHTDQKARSGVCF